MSSLCNDVIYMQPHHISNYTYKWHRIGLAISQDITSLTPLGLAIRVGTVICPSTAVSPQIILVVCIVIAISCPPCMTNRCPTCILQSSVMLSNCLCVQSCMHVYERTCSFLLCSQSAFLITKLKWLTCCFSRL